MIFWEILMKISHYHNLNSWQYAVIWAIYMCEPFFNYTWNKIICWQLEILGIPNGLGLALAYYLPT